MRKALIVCGALLMLACPRARAQANAPEDGARMLLVYDGTNAAMAQEDVERVSAMMTALGKPLTFGDIRDYADALSQYETVICYRLEEIAPREMKAVCGYGGRLLIMGSDFMRRYLTETGQGEMVVRETDFDRGVLRCALSPENAFEEIVAAENIALFRTQDAGGGTILIGDQAYPFFGRVASAWFTPVTSLSSPLARTALMQEIANRTWPYEDAPPDYAQYLVLDAVYPFMDAQTLLEKVDALIEEGVPYVLSVMPLYRNAAYPAMGQLCQVLQYAQQHGGFVILHAPIIQAVRQDAEELYAALTEALDAYIDNGVYPLGIKVPVSWTNDDFTLDAMRRFRTVFVYDDGAPSGFSLDAGHNRLYDHGHQLVMPAIPLDETGVPRVTCYSSAVYLDAYATQTARLREMARALKSERVPFGDLWKLDHAVWANDLSLRCEGGTLYRNDEPVRLTYEPTPFDEDYDYARGLIDRITVSIQRQSRVLTALTLVVVAVFAACTAYLRRVNRRSFFYGDE